MLMPTARETAATIAETGKDDETYTRFNLRMLRNGNRQPVRRLRPVVPCTWHRTSRHDDRRNAKHRPQDPWRSVWRWKKSPGSCAVEFDGRIKQRQQLTPLWRRMSVRALFGRDRRVGECLLLREKRKSGLRGPISVVDPQRTSLT